MRDLTSNLSQQGYFWPASAVPWPQHTTNVITAPTQRRPSGTGPVPRHCWNRPRKYGPFDQSNPVMKTRIQKLFVCAALVRAATLVQAQFPYTDNGNGT